MIDRMPLSSGERLQNCWDEQSTMTAAAMNRQQQLSCIRIQRAAVCGSLVFETAVVGHCWTFPHENVRKLLLQPYDGPFGSSPDKESMQVSRTKDPSFGNTRILPVTQKKNSPCLLEGIQQVIGRGKTWLACLGLAQPTQNPSAELFMCSNIE